MVHVCVVASCDIGSSGSAPDCGTCDNEGYTGTSTWDSDSGTWSACGVASCDIGSSPTAPDCGTCDVTGYTGTSTWDSGSGTWSACTGKIAC